jgi:phage shock protein E
MDLKTAINHPSANIVDVRERLEFFFGHARKAINIPLSRLPNKIESFKSMEGPIILYCRSGNRSEQAKTILKSKGIKQVYNAGGLSEVRALLKK